MPASLARAFLAGDGQMLQFTCIDWIKHGEGIKLILAQSMIPFYPIKLDTLKRNKWILYCQIGGDFGVEYAVLEKLEWKRC